MKKNYLFLVMIVLANTLMFAQSCPPTGFSNGSSLFFFYNTGTSLCEDRPATVNVDASVFTLSDCGDAYSVYDLTSGAALSNPNMFTADFGYGTCEYTNGNLTNEMLLSVEEFNAMDSTSIKVYPNPVTAGSNNLFVDFGNANVSVKVSVYTVTGKQVLTTSVDNFSKATVNVSSLTNGMYLVKIDSGTKTVTRKFVVMK
ncbi:MAG TPA: T9SS type A sorting domain-containing protein [Flavobacteriaceae bacterium]|nr:T9SS type A sorting domain-containing protein [Flavobacteriaceae bacterium]